MGWLPCPNPACPTVGRAHLSQAALMRCVRQHPGGPASTAATAAVAAVDAVGGGAAERDRADHVRVGATVQLADRDRRLFGDTATVTAVDGCDFAACPHELGGCVTLRTAKNGSINRSRRDVLVLPLPVQASLWGHRNTPSRHLPPRTTTGVISSIQFPVLQNKCWVKGWKFVSRPNCRYYPLHAKQNYNKPKGILGVRV